MKNTILLAIFLFFAMANYAQNDSNEIIEEVVPFPDKSDDNTPYMQVEEMPFLDLCAVERMNLERHKCTKVAIEKHFEENNKYPKGIKGNKGTVFIQFVVGKTGNVEDVNILRSIHPELDKEAVRLANNLPKFVPGKQNGKAVRVKLTFAINFKK